MTNVRISNVYIILGLFLVVGLLAACQSLVPANTPVQLNQTPGAPIRITNNQIDTDWFTLTYPDGWRVVTNVAIEPLRLTLVSPDDAMLVIVEDARDGCLFPESTPDPNVHHREECVGTNGAALAIWGRPEIQLQAIYDPKFEMIISSIEFR